VNGGIYPSKCLFFSIILLFSDRGRAILPAWRLSSRHKPAGKTFLAPSHVGHGQDLAAVKGLHQNVAAAQVQDLGPAAARRHGQETMRFGGLTAALKIGEQYLPVGVLDIGVADGDLDAPIC